MPYAFLDMYNAELNSNLNVACIVVKIDGFLDALAHLMSDVLAPFCYYQVSQR